MNFLIISDAWHPQINGVVRTYEHLIEELTKRGHSVKIIGPADFPLRMPMPGYSEIKLTLAPYTRLKRMIDAYRPEQIHIATEGPLGWAARRYCLKHDKAFSTAYHTHFPDYLARRIAKHLPFLHKAAHDFGKKVILRFHAPAQIVMTATQSLEDELRSWGFKNKMHRLTRGADLALFYPAKSPESKTTYKDLKKPIALYVGRIAIEKSVEDFLKMPWEGTKVIIGDGPRRASLTQKYPDTVFLGSKTGEDLAAHYRDADLFVFPSRTDTFGMVLVEALASGLPVAAYNVTGPKDIITENFLGSLSDDNLAKAAEQALKIGTPRQRRTHVEEQYTWEKAMRQFENAHTDKT